MEMRRAISREREAACATIKLATLAQAMRRTKKTRTPRAKRAVRLSCWKKEAPEEAGLMCTVWLSSRAISSGDSLTQDLERSVSKAREMESKRARRGSRATPGCTMAKVRCQVESFRSA